MLNKLCYGALLLLAWFFLHCLWVVWDGFREPPAKADIAVVLGNTVYADGSLSPWLQGRVDEALHLYRNGQVKKIFVSGGTGTSEFPEGDGMRNYLVQQGVPGSDVLVDNLGNNSYLTAKHFVELNGQQHFSSAVMVTSYYHITRTKYITRKLGFEQVSGASSKSLFWADWYGLTREFVAFYKYMLVY
jgi:vancomycin permeability regulator SanA